MIRINLLPSETQITGSAINPAFVVAGVVVVLLVVLSVFSYSQYKTKNDLLDKTRFLQSELDRYKPTLDQVDALEKERSQLQQQKNVINQLESERLRYPEFMDDFLKLLPGNVWLTNLTTTQLPDGVSMNVGMDIVALDNYAIADLISNLETSQLFSNVDLGAITLNQTPTEQTLHFHINTTYKKVSLTPDAIKKS